MWRPQRIIDLRVEDIGLGMSSPVLCSGKEDEEQAQSWVAGFGELRKAGRVGMGMCRGGPGDLSGLLSAPLCHPCHPMISDTRTTCTTTAQFLTRARAILDPSENPSLQLGPVARPFLLRLLEL
jgi:hypothetical protein